MNYFVTLTYSFLALINDHECRFIFYRRPDCRNKSLVVYKDLNFKSL